MAWSLFIEGAQLGSLANLSPYSSSCAPGFAFTKCFFWGPWKRAESRALWQWQTNLAYKAGLPQYTQGKLSPYGRKRQRKQLQPGKELLSRQSPPDSRWQQSRMQNKLLTLR